MMGVLEMMGFLGKEGVLEDLSVRTVMYIIPGVGPGNPHASQNFFSRKYLYIYKDPLLK
jgi:hypothetical protein